MSKTLDDMKLPSRNMLSNKVSNHSYEKSSSSSVKNSSPKQSIRENTMSAM